MHLLQPDLHARRAFLVRAGQLAAAGAGLPLALNLAAIGEAAAFGATGYRALVCVYLSGGNDHDNTVVPYDPGSYDRYSAARGGGPNRSAGGIALGRDALAPTALAPRVPLAGGRQYALNPALAGLTSLFDAGHLAVVLNVGPLIVPVTRAQWAGTDRVRYPLPPKQFSHNDQTSVWQSSAPEGATSGWGGRIGDLALAGNSETLFTCISVGGNAVFLAGRQALQYQLTSAGAVATDCVRRPVYGSIAVRDAIAQIVTRAPSGVFEAEYNRVVARSLASEAKVGAALAGVRVDTPFAGGALAEQLRMVARLIAARAVLGVKRQVFMVNLGGFDTHGALLGRHAALMRQLDPALSSFYQATVDLGVADQVTTFTASEFGRTLSSNGDGSDHGWGSHHLVIGGAVRGGLFYGTPPPVSVGNSDAPEDQEHVGQGRLIPSIALDQYAATLALWFGVEPAELGAILPYLGNFGDPAHPINLGFV
ncbi:MAG: DUF1501 domain-containing protein [Rubrivivax sp.]|nr:DUF1501 domain-containing protein [Rubrivivax sp.]